MAPGKTACPRGLSRNAFPIALLLLASIAPGLAQERGSIFGTVSDSSGAAVPGATIQVYAATTSVTRTTTTNSAGYYIVGDLIPDQYSVTAEGKGFKKTNQPPFKLDVAQAARIDLRLEVGDVTESVSVQAAAPLLATSDATVGQVIGPVMMSQLPLNDRNYLQLALISPGTGTYGKSSFYNSALTDDAGAIISGSAGEDRNAFSLDGADIKSYLINGSFVPSIDAVQEFKIETTPYSAELGTSPGAQILLVTKNGTNQLHGSAYEFLRNSDFDAKNYFDNQSLPIPELRKNQFGGTIGGPIVKDKLFYFGNYEETNERVGETFFGTVPTLLERQGNFTEIGPKYFQSLYYRCLFILLKRVFAIAISRQHYSRLTDQSDKRILRAKPVPGSDLSRPYQQLRLQRRGSHHPAPIQHSRRLFAPQGLDFRQVQFQQFDAFAGEGNVQFRGSAGLWRQRRD
jgi:hypothetical protein